MSLFKHINFSRMFFLFFTLSTSQIATAGFFSSWWTETFYLDYGHYVRHTPSYVTFDDIFTAGKGIYMHHTNINGFMIDNLDIKTDSTREEFVEALSHVKIYKVK